MFFLGFIVKQEPVIGYSEAKMDVKGATAWLKKLIIAIIMNVAIQNK